MLDEGARDHDLAGKPDTACNASKDSFHHGGALSRCVLRRRSIRLVGDGLSKGLPRSAVGWGIHLGTKLSRGLNKRALVIRDRARLLELERVARRKVVEIKEIALGSVRVAIAGGKEGLSERDVDVAVRLLVVDPVKTSNGIESKDV